MGQPLQAQTILREESSSILSSYGGGSQLPIIVAPGY